MPSMSSVTKVFFGRAEVVFTPKLLHELEDIELELVGVDAGESGEGEGPAEEGGTEGNRPVGRIDLLGLTHFIALEGGVDNVGVLNDTLEVLVHGFAIDLEFVDAAIVLVDEKNGLDLLTESLTENSIGLDADTFDVVDDDESVCYMLSLWGIVVGVDWHSNSTNQDFNRSWVFNLIVITHSFLPVI